MTVWVYCFGLALFLLAFSTPVQAADNAQAFKSSLTFSQAKLQSFPPKFQMFNLQDKPETLPFGKGQPWRLVNFWAAWCPPCLTELPSLQALEAKEKNNKHFQVLLVSADMPVGAAELIYLMKQRNLQNVDTHYLKDFDTWQSFGIDGLPTTMLVSPEGKIVYTIVGGADWDSPGAIAFFKTVLPPGTQP
jgi:thiol-disulfide isomerase/thioredoxin